MSEKYKKGDLVWKDGTRQEVVFTENLNGKFLIPKRKEFWLRFWRNGLGICFTPKNEALFSIRNGYRKSLFIFGWHIYFLKPQK